jgi:hypothetical protein
MIENMDKWPFKHRKTEKSGHRLAAEKTLFPRRWYGGMISANLEVIREMSFKTRRLSGPSVCNLIVSHPNYLLTIPTHYVGLLQTYVIVRFGTYRFGHSAVDARSRCSIFYATFRLPARRSS